MKTARSILLAASLVLATACGGGGKAGGNGPDPTPVKDWVFLAFLDGDGDREWQATTNLAQFEQVNTAGSSVEIVAFLDRHPKGSGGGYFQQAIPTVGGTDWADSLWGPVTYDGVETAYASNLVPLTTFAQELDVGHSATLGMFVNQAMAKHPAKHYALIIFDHGSPYGVAWDETNKNDYLTTKELGQAFDAVPFVDVLVLDACNMQHVEVATQLVGEVGYILASQQGRWAKPLGSNIYYDRALTWLVSNPSATPKAFASRLLLEDQHSTDAYVGNASVVDVKGIPALNQALDDFADAALKDASIQDWAVLAGLQTSAQYFHSTSYRDLREYLGAIHPHAALPNSIRAAAKKAYDLLDPVTGSVVVGKEGPGSGISVVVPPSNLNIPWWYTANRLDFADDSASHGTSWLAYLMKLPAFASPWLQAFIDGLQDVLPDEPPEAPLIGGYGVVSWIDSVLEDPTDVDLLRIDVTPSDPVEGGEAYDVIEDTVLYVEVVGDPSVDNLPALTVYGPDGETPLGQAVADASGMAMIEGLVLGSGPHYLAVSAAGEGAGRYRLRCLYGRPEDVAPRLEVSADLVDLGEADVDTWGTAELALSNPGGSPLRILDLALPEESIFVAPYEQIQIPVILNPGETIRLRVGARPRQAGVEEAILRVLSSDPLAPDVEVQVAVHGR